MKKVFKVLRANVFILVGSVVFILVLIIPILFNELLLSWRANGVYGETETWINFLGTYYGAVTGGTISGLLTLLGVRYTINLRETSQFKQSYPKKRKLSDDIISEITEVYRVGKLDMKNPKNQYRDFLYEKMNNIDEVLNNASEIGDKVYEAVRKKYVVSLRSFYLESVGGQKGDGDRRLYYLKNIKSCLNIIMSEKTILENKYKSLSD